MAYLGKGRWDVYAAGPTRRDRRPCDYAVYWSDALAGRNFFISMSRFDHRPCSRFPPRRGCLDGHTRRQTKL